MRLAAALVTLLSVVPGANASEPPPDRSEIVLRFVGDVSLAGRPVPRGAVTGEDNPLGAFRELFEGADLSVANLEGLLTQDEPAQYAQKRLNIGASPIWAPIFRDAGVDLVGTANNHSWDGGARGVLENLEHVRKTGVAVFGTGRTDKEAMAPYILGEGPRCVAVLPATIKSNRPRKRGAAAAYYRGDAEHDRLIAAVRLHDTRRCFVVVTIHWGREGVHRPPGKVHELAHRLVDAGARLVVGHHPHVLQGVERGDGWAIAYSLGNFVFTNRTPAKRRTGVLEVRLRPRGDRLRLAEVAMVPAVIRVPSFNPTPASSAERRDLRERMAEYSAPFGTEVVTRGERLVFVGKGSP